MPLFLQPETDAPVGAAAPASSAATSPLSASRAGEAALKASLHAGETLSDRYVIEHVHRAGGMGVVYRARDRESGAPVAIKVLGQSGPRRVLRFEREIAILAELEHPAVVKLLGSGATPDGSLYLAMEWLEGEDLSERLRHGRLPPEASVRILEIACEGLAYAHQRGIVHRDIKPSNLFLQTGPELRVKVLDFGIAHGIDVANSLTQPGDILGTVGYIAPEQAMGRTNVDARADVFALGCVLYECLTGRPPFESSHPVAVLAKVLRDDPTPVTELCPELSPAIDAFLARVLAKEPGLRPADAGAMRTELEAAAAGRRSSPFLARPRLTRSEQKIVSVILGKPQSTAGAKQAATVDEEDLRYLSQNFAADVCPLQGGALLLVLPGRGEANDRAAQAAQCALALSKLRPELQVGVATGLAETSGPIPVGAAIDRAAALLDEQHDAPKNVLVDDLTAGLIGLRFEVRSTPAGNLLVGPRVELDAPRKLMGRPTPCVGREMELRLLNSATEESVEEGVSRVVLVTGPPGIGKSRLASEWLASRKAGGGVRILVARADPMTSTSALSLVQNLVRDAAGLHDAETPAALREHLSLYLNRLLPRAAASAVLEFVAEVLGLPEARTSSFGSRAEARASTRLRAARNNPEIMREQLRRALDAWIDAEIERSPLLVVLEDLHWGDAPSVEFLSRALKRPARFPLLLLALARPDLERRFPELCQSAALQIRLRGLTPRAAEKLVRVTLEPAPSDEVVAEIVGTAEGNAFYLEELIRRVAAGSAVRPETVLAMAQSRLEHLESTERCVLRAASVFGETCWAEGVACIVEPGIDSDALLKLLAEREILVPVHAARYPGMHEYRFRHALLRDAAYAMLTPRDREQAHYAAGDWLERTGEKEARLLAEHFVSAQMPERAIPWLVRAARSAIDHGDLSSTVELANRGIALGASGEDCGHLLLARGYAEAWGSVTDVSRLSDALHLLPHGSPHWWLAVALLTLAESASGRPDEAERYVALALAAPHSGEQAGPFAQALHTLVGALVLLGRGELASTLIERAQALPTSEDDPIFAAFLGAARCALAAVAPLAGRWHLEFAYRHGQQAIETMHDLGTLCGEAMALNYFAVAATHLGRYQEAAEATGRALALAQHVGSGLTRDWAQVFLAKAQVRLSQPAAALATLDALHTSDRNLQQMLPAITSEALFHQGEFEQAIRAAEAAVSGASPRLRRMAGSIRARSLLALGRPRDALAAVEQAWRERTSTGLESEIDLSAARAEALLAVGERQAATEAIRGPRDFVLSVAADIPDPQLRASFLQRVEGCARTLRLASELL